MATSFRLTMQRGPNVGKTYELVKDVVTLGRDMSNDIVINDSEASRHHSRFTKQGSSYLLEDLGSTNGTFVNSARLSSPRPINNGDVIGIGETVALNYEAATAAPTGATMIGNIDATVVASSDMPSAREMQEMAAAAAPAYEPPTTPMAQPVYSAPSTSSYTPPPPPASDSLLAKPAEKNNTMMYVGIGGGAFILLCCCCPAITWVLWTFVGPMLNF